MAADLDVLQHRKILEKLHELEGAHEARTPRSAPAAAPVMSSPANTMRPAFGVWKPEIRLNSVVLPAPFGPMTAVTPPSATSRSMASTATRPPNRRVTPCSDSSVMRLPPRDIRLPSAGEPLRRVDQQQDEARAIDQVLIVLEAAKDLRQQADDHRAEDRAADGADAADIEHREGQHDHVQPEHFGADELDHMHEQRARERRIGGRDQERRELVARDVDAERAGRVLAAGDGGQARGRSAMRAAARRHKVDSTTITMSAKSLPRSDTIS